MEIWRLSDQVSSAAATAAAKTEVLLEEGWRKRTSFLTPTPRPNIAPAPDSHEHSIDPGSGDSGLPWQQWGKVLFLPIKRYPHVPLVAPLFYLKQNPNMPY